MAVAEYVTKTDLLEALKPISADMRAIEERLESRIYTVKGEIIGRIEAFEVRILAEIRNGR